MTMNKIALLLYSEYFEILNIHMTLLICFDDFHFWSHGILHMETVCQDSYYCTKIWCIKMLIPTAQLLNFYNYTFWKGDYECFPQEKTKQDRTKPALYS